MPRTFDEIEREAQKEMRRALRLRRFRARRNWSQQRAADWYGCDVRTWRRYELGERAVPKPVLRAIDRAG